MSKQLNWLLILIAVGTASLCMCGGVIYVAKFASDITPSQAGITGTPRPTRTPSPTYTPAPTRTPRPTRTATPDVGNGYVALALCQEVVRGQLKAPSSATFAKASESIMIESSPGMWLVSSWVDSQNSFGAMLRTMWTCQIAYTGNGNWVPMTVEFK